MNKNYCFINPDVKESNNNKYKKISFWIKNEKTNEIDMYIYIWGSTSTPYPQINSFEECN